MVPFSFVDQEMRLVAGRALFWPREQALLVADLHLEKASFFASHGQMLPPYDSRETLERVLLAIKETGARRVFCLGDNFHDGDGPGRLEPYAAGMLATLTRVLDWVWITGNHDAGGTAPEGGALLEKVEIGGIHLRHQPEAGMVGAEISGHFHPRLVVYARGRRIARPCVVASDNRMILPAFGALAGGMDAKDPAITGAMQPARSIDALLAAAGQLVRYPIWRASE